MRLGTRIIGMMALAALAGCGSGTGLYGGGGGGGGPAGSVTVGNNGQIVFISAHNGTTNPAVDTVVVGGTVTWTWTNDQGISHSVRSQGSSSFASSAIMSANGQTYAVTFPAPGTYQYDCAVHGAAMSGTIVVR